MLLASTSPLFVPIIALLAIGERPRPLLFVLLAVGFGGVAAIVLPSAADGLALHESTATWGLLAAAGTGLTSAAAVVCIRRLTSGDHPLTIVFAFASWCLVTSLPAVVEADPQDLAAAALPLAVTTLFAIGGQVFITYALQSAPAGGTIIFNYTGVVLSFVVGLLWWGEQPTIWSVLGAVAIVAVCVVTTRHGARLVTVSTNAKTDCA